MGMKKNNELKFSEDDFKLLFEKSNDPVLIIKQYKFLECNLATAKFLGYSSPKELYNLHASDISPKYQPDGKLSYDKANELIDIAYKEGYCRFEWVHVAKNGKEFTMDIALTKIPYKGENMIFTIWRDITKSKEYEKEIKNREQQYTTLFEQAADGILVGIKGGEIINANESICKLTKYTKDELIGQNINILFDKNDLKKNPLRYDLVKKGDNVINERNIIRKDGIIIPVEMNTKGLKDGRMQALLRDLTKRKEAEKIAQENQLMIEKITEQSPDIIYIYNVEKDQNIYINKNIAKILGYTGNIVNEESIKQISKLIHSDDLKQFENYEQKVNNWGSEYIKEFEYRLQDANGLWHWYFGREKEFQKVNNKVISIIGVASDITERIKARNEAKYNKSLLEEAEKIAGIGRYNLNIVDEKWSSSEVLNAIFGIDVTYDKNIKNWLKIVHPQFRDEMKNYLLKNVIKEHQLFDKVYKIIRINDHEERWVHGLGKVEYNEDNKPVRMIGTVQDITKRKEIEIALKENEEKYRNIFHNSPLGILHYNKDGVITDCNDHFVSIIGSSKKVLIGLNMFTDLNNKEIVKAVKQSLKNGKSYYEDWYTSVTGQKTTFVRILFEGIQDNDNQIVSGIGLVEDITKRTLAEQELKISEEKFKSIATLLPEVVFEMDLKGNLTFVNLQAYKIFEYTPEDFKKGLNVFQMLAPFEIERANEIIKKPKTKNENKGEKYIAVTKTGKQFPILIYSDYIIKNQNIIGLRGIIVNISELEKTQNELIKSEEKFRNIYNSSSDIILILNQKGQILNVNKTVEKHLGYTDAEFIGSNIREYIIKSDIDEAEYRMSSMYLGKKVPIREMKMISKHGLEIPVEVNSKIIEYNGKKSILSIIRNIKERKDLEQRIYETMIEAEEKERQRLASDIHDEIGPLLSSLKMYIESLNKTNDPEKQQFLKTKLQALVKDSITNVREVSNALSPYLLRKYGLKVALKAFLEVSKELINIDFKINFEKERFPINTETVYYRIIKELFNNTIKHADAKNIKILLTYSDKKLFLKYEDDGKGMKQKDLSNIDKNGMGLLNITNRIKSINGSYKFYTNKKGFKLEVIKQTETI